MVKREFKDKIYGEISRLTKAFSNPQRLEIIDLLSNGEKNVEEIAEETGNSMANASQHLQVLKRERLVKTRRAGVQIHYMLASVEVYHSWKHLRNLSINLSPYVKSTLMEYKGSRKLPEPIEYRLIKDVKNVVLLDVRPKDEYDAQHLDCAISIPIEELSTRYRELDINTTIVAYCRGLFCDFADRAVLFLRKKGFYAEKLEENILELNTSVA